MWGWCLQGNNTRISAQPLLEPRRPDTFKARTAILFRCTRAQAPAAWDPQDWEFDSFGNDAIRKANTLEGDAINRHMLFESFKMALYAYGLTDAAAGRVPTVNPSRGPNLDVPVRYLFSQILKQVVESALGSGGKISSAHPDRTIDHINWQVCHPANFPLEAKEVLRLAAGDAGITENHTGESELFHFC